MGVHLALGIWEGQLASVPVGLRTDSCFPSRYKLHDKQRRWELWGPSHPLTTWLVLPWISGCVHFPTLRLGFTTTWASAQTCINVSKGTTTCYRWAMEPREGPTSGCMLACSGQRFPFRFVQASAEAFPTRYDLYGKDRVYFRPLSLEEKSLSGRKTKRRNEKSFFSQMWNRKFAEGLALLLTYFSSTWGSGSD